MSDPWNKTAAIQEANLAEIMSEELSNRLIVENDFVWVDIPEKQIKFDSTESTFTTKDESCNQSSEDIADIVQSEMDKEKQFIDVAEIDEDYELDYWEQLEKPNNVNRQKYTLMPYLKRSVHNTVPVHNSDKLHDIKPVNDLLPKMKFNASTTAVLQRLITNRYLGKYHEVIGRGKSSIVFGADCHRNNCITIPIYNAVKVYKTGNDVEKNKIVFKRVQREFEHLNLLNKNSNIHKQNVPWPLRAWENVILMSVVSFTCTMKDVESDMDGIIYNTIIQFMDTCYNRLHLVHGKLSVNKISIYNHPFHLNFIGWSHSVKTNHPLAHIKLIRDCKFVTEFYQKRGLAVMSTEDLFKKITGHTKITGKLMKIINNKDLYEKYSSNPNRSSSPVKVNTTLRFK